MARKKILIVDDDKLIRLSLEKFLARLGYEVLAAATGERAVKIIEEEAPALVLLDLKLPNSIDGLQVLEIIRKNCPEIKVIMISGHSEIRSAVDAMKNGAYDFLEKPIDFERLHELLKRVGQEKKGGRGRGRGARDNVAYASEAMKQISEIAQRLALKSDVTILILGETGTGKNYLCRKIHQVSARRDAPYIQISCANIPEHLIESELFGYEKGAFTDAKNSKQGLVEAAEGGTLLLDEIGEMPYQCQAKILGLLEDKRFRRIGALADAEADVRILAATNQNLYELVQQKRFRLDLFYRLDVATIKLPPLRERREDIPLLARHFLAQFGTTYDGSPKTVAPDAMRLLEEYSWPGNVRQLKNVIERLVVLSEGERIERRDITSALLVQQQMEEQAAGGRAEVEGEAGLSLGAMEEKYIRTAMKLAGGNQRRAAEMLEISRDTLRYRLKRLGFK